MDDYDSPWKAILYHFEDFMRFFFAEASQDIDWSRGFRFLDGELQKVLRKSQTGRRYVDKLIEVHLKEKGETWLLIHVEVQSERDKDFAERVFIYDSRLYDHFGKKVVSLVILADDSREWRPSAFGYELWGYKHFLIFPSVKLRDYARIASELEQSDNIFALVVLAHLESRDTKNDLTRRQNAKRRLLRLLFRKGYHRDKVFALIAFLDWVLALPDNIDDKLWEDVNAWEEVRTMEYIPSFARKSYFQGKEEGLKEGKAEGAISLFEELLKDRFGSLPDWVSTKIKDASLDRLNSWARNVHRRNSLEEVFD
jgi:hypothetical protein